jgi:hypothetical protein
MTGINISIVLFGITTLLGMYLSTLAIRRKQTPKGMIIIHGLLSIAGFMLLSAYWPDSVHSILLFAVGTLSGMVLLYEDLTGKKFTTLFCYVHAILTISGMIFLIGMLNR